MSNIETVRLPDGTEYNIKDAVTPRAEASQPNLLTNPWFTVNQRGVTSFSGSSNDVYTADRWIVRRATGSVNNNGISFAWDGVHSTSGLISTHIEDMPDLFGKTVTLSALVNGNIISYSFTLNDNETKYVGDNNEFFIDTQNLAGAIVINYYNYTTTAVTVRAMKLEKGSVSTLYLDTAPNYTTELLKCQRYFYRITATSANAYWALGCCSTSSACHAIIDLPTPMRTTATASFTGTMQAFVNETAYAISGIHYTLHRTNTCICLDFSGTSLPSGSMSLVRFTSVGDHIDFDAEL